MAQTIDLIKNTSFETKMDNLISAVVSGGGGTSSYTYLADKPSINGNTLEGNKTNSQLGISSASYKTISVGATDVNATTVDDDLSIIAGTNMTITPDSVNKTITFASVGGSGTGDMLKSTYDTNNDGIVDEADHATNADKVGNAITAVLEKLSDVSGQLNYNGNTVGSDYINSVSNEFSVVNKKLSLATSITTKLAKVDDKEDTLNKVTTLSSSSTDTQYPSAKCVYDLVGDVESLLASL